MQTTCNIVLQILNKRITPYIKIKSYDYTKFYLSAANQSCARTFVNTAHITRAGSWLCFFAPDTTRITMLGLLIHIKNRVSVCVCSAAEEFKTILICTNSLCFYSQAFHSYKVKLNLSDICIGSIIWYLTRINLDLFISDSVNRGSCAL